MASEPVVRTSLLKRLDGAVSDVMITKNNVYRTQCIVDQTRNPSSPNQVTETVRYPFAPPYDFIQVYKSMTPEQRVDFLGKAIFAIKVVLSDVGTGHFAFRPMSESVEAVQKGLVSNTPLPLASQSALGFTTTLKLVD